MIMKTNAPCNEMQLNMVVTRCGCPPGIEHPGEVCPRPRKIEDLGTVAYYHRNPLRRVFYRLVRAFRPNCYFGGM
jgi:hypothetical protein